MADQCHRSWPGEGHYYYCEKSDTQYNAIFDTYGVFYPANPSERSPFPPALLEEYQIEHVLTSPASPVSITGKNVLDLAGGSGYYSLRHLLRWHAAKVVCCDISEDMIETGRKTAAAVAVERGARSADFDGWLKFAVGDAAGPDLSNVVLPLLRDDDDDNSADGGERGSGFDIVTAAWLLNYAESREMLGRMWANVGRCLRPGGWFVALMTPPLMTDKEFESDLLAEACSEEGAWGRFGTGGAVISRMPGHEGYKAKTTLLLPGENGEKVKSVSFENFFLRKDIVEGAAKQTNLFRDIRWMDFVISDKLRNDYPEMSGCATLMPHCRVCIARRTG